jgi:hypothetical protein
MNAAVSNYPLPAQSSPNGVRCDDERYTAERRVRSWCRNGTSVDRRELVGEIHSINKNRETDGDDVRRRVSFNAASLRLHPFISIREVERRFACSDV